EHALSVEEPGSVGNETALTSELGTSTGSSGRCMAFASGPSARLPSIRTVDEAQGPSGLPAGEAGPSVESGRYRIVGEIARGGMGAVLKGWDLDLDRDLAVKVLLEEHRDHPDLVRRFIDEARIGGRLQHPGIVPVHELGTLADRRPYFTMKLVEGHTLASLL